MNNLQVIPRPAGLDDLLEDYVRFVVIDADGDVVGGFKTEAAAHKWIGEWD